MSSSAVAGRRWCKLHLNSQAGVDNKLRRSLDAKLSELQESLKKHNQEELQRKFAVRYHKVNTLLALLTATRRLNTLGGASISCLSSTWFSVPSTHVQML